MDEPGSNFAASFLGLSKRRRDDGRAMFALRLYGDAADFGVSLEVSFIERKKRRAEPSKTTHGSHPSHHSASLLFRPEKWRESKGRRNRKEIAMIVARQ